jgi:hypothetical protein
MKLFLGHRIPMATFKVVFMHHVGCFQVEKLMLYLGLLDGLHASKPEREVYEV